MKRRGTTVDDLEAFYERLQGPMGKMLCAAGVIMERRLRERGREMASLTDGEVMDLLYSSMLEAAPDSYPHVDRQVLDQAMSDLFAKAAMEMAANTDGSDRIH